MKVWRAQPEYLGAAQWRALARLLDVGEQAQVARLRFAADRAAHVLAHGLRRLALAQLLGLPATDAAALRFGHDAAGRPFLRSACNWFFSHAHARDGVLFAACREHPVGIDIEPLDHRMPDPSLLRRYIEWPQHPGLDWETPAGFADGWTALESFVKALGCGLPGLSMAQSAAPVRCATLSLGNAWHRPLRLSMQTHKRQEALVLRLLAPPGCAAALAVRQGAKAPPPRLDEYRLDADAALLARLS